MKPSSKILPNNYLEQSFALIYFQTWYIKIFFILHIKSKKLLYVYEIENYIKYDF